MDVLNHYLFLTLKFSILNRIVYTTSQVSFQFIHKPYNLVYQTGEINELNYCLQMEFQKESNILCSI